MTGLALLVGAILCFGIAIGGALRLVRLWREYRQLTTLSEREVADQLRPHSDVLALPVDPPRLS